MVLSCSRHWIQLNPADNFNSNYEISKAHENALFFDVTEFAQIVLIVSEGVLTILTTGTLE